MKDTYTIIIDSPIKKGISKGTVSITREGALIIGAAYAKLYGNTQSMDRREERGGICWLSEIDYWKSQGALDKNFNWKDYEVKV